MSDLKIEDLTDEEVSRILSAALELERVDHLPEPVTYYRAYTKLIQEINRVKTRVVFGRYA